MKAKVNELPQQAKLTPFIVKPNSHNKPCVIRFYFFCHHNALNVKPMVFLTQRWDGCILKGETDVSRRKHPSHHPNKKKPHGLDILKWNRKTNKPPQKGGLLSS